MSLVAFEALSCVVMAWERRSKRNWEGKKERERDKAVDSRPRNSFLQKDGTRKKRCRVYLLLIGSLNPRGVAPLEKYVSHSFGSDWFSLIGILK